MLDEWCAVLDMVGVVAERADAHWDKGLKRLFA